MKTVDLSDAEREAACTAAARALLDRHQWRLVDAETLAQRTLLHLTAGLATTPERAAMYSYSLALYIACSGQEGEYRREMGFVDLHHYLVDAAYTYYRDVWEDAAQLACERLEPKLDTIRHPAAFLKVARQSLRDAARYLRRQEKDSVSLEDVPEPHTPGASPLPGIIQAEQARRLRTVITSYLQKHKRAHDQILAFMLKHLEGLDDEAIGERLGGKTVAQVQMLRTRARQRLRQDPDWIALARDLGILAAEAPEDQEEYQK